MNDFFIMLYEVFTGPYKFGRDFRKFFVFLAYLNILTSILLPVIYYLVLNKFSTTKFASIFWWLMFMLLNALISLVFVIMFAKAYHILSNNSIHYNTYTWYVVIVNVFYAVILFFFSSLLFKNLGSNHARKIPF